MRYDKDNNGRQGDLFSNDKQKTCHGDKGLVDALKEELWYLQKAYRRELVDLTNFSEINWLTTGFAPSTLTLIAGEPSIGKTSLAVSIMKKTALVQNKRVLYFSLSMPRHMLTRRLISSESGINFQRMSLGILGPSDWSKICNAASRLLTLYKEKIFLDDSSVTPEGIMQTIRAMRENKGVECVILDDIQGIKNTGNDDRGHVFDLLKKIALELRISVLAITNQYSYTEDATSFSFRLADEGKEYLDMVYMLCDKNSKKAKNLRDLIMAPTAKNEFSRYARVALKFDSDTLAFDLQPVLNLKLVKSTDEQTDATE